jgi:hypothetical protein
LNWADPLVVERELVGKDLRGTNDRKTMHTKCTMILTCMITYWHYNSYVL